ncbi:MAG: phosphohydrolase [Actinomycetota bacterium]
MPTVLGAVNFTRCPGQDKRNLKAEIHKCSQCGYEVEIFSDEMGTKCRQCGAMVYRERVPSCIDWCSAAKFASRRKIIDLLKGF